MGHAPARYGSTVPPGNPWARTTDNTIKRARGEYVTGRIDAERFEAIVWDALHGRNLRPLLDGPPRPQPDRMTTVRR